MRALIKMVSAQKFGMTMRKSDSFSEWYTQLVTRCELIDYYEIKGCYIMRPASMHIWSIIKDYFNKAIFSMGIQECYFPLLITQKKLELEKNHISNFNPELVWITKCGDKSIEEPIAIRPTSEAIIYPSFSKWLKTYRDLPLKLNQWCSVLRWEVKSTIPFIRGREFLWQEGHTAHYDKESAEKEVRDILELYSNVYKDLLAIPVIKGKKSKNETFGGAEYTLSIEAFIPATGRGAQAATSHFLGQNFSKMFDIVVESSKEEKKYVYQNSWGLTTRCIGIAAMIHSDDRGFVCTPSISNIQIVIIPCGLKANTNEDDKYKLENYINNIFERLKNDWRIHFDNRTHVTVGYKFNHWELRGVPLRIEIGLRDMNNNNICVVRRDNNAKTHVSINEIEEKIKQIASTMHNELYFKAKTELDSKIQKPKNFEEMSQLLIEKCICLIPWCQNPECENNITAKTTIYENGEIIRMGAKSLCIPFDTPSCEELSCLNCKMDDCVFTLFGLSY